MSVTPLPTITPEVTLDSGSLAGELLTVKVERELGVPGRATVRCEAPWDWNPSSAPHKFGDVITIADKEGGLIFKGELTGITMEVTRGRREVQLVAHDRSHRLALGTYSESYVGRSPSVLVQELAGRHNLALTSSANDSAGQDDYRSQDGTDLDLLDHLSARTGRVWWVEPQQSGRDQLRWEPIGTSTATVDLTLERVRAFELRASGLRPESVQVTGWNATTRRPVTATKPVTAPDRPVVAQGFPGSADGKRKLVVREASPLTDAEATELATSIAAFNAADTVHARGELQFNRQVAPSTTVNLTGAGALSGKYLVTSVEHYFDTTGGTTRFVAGPPRAAGLADLLGPRPAGDLVDGVISAIVTDVADPQKRGRVKVKYTAGEEKLTTHWARVLTLGAGPSRGFELLPEVDDEVLVAFEQGDTRRPVVLGGLFSQQQTLPPSPTEGNHAGGAVVYRRLTTRAGHVIELADANASADQYVLIQLGGKKHRIRLGGDKTDITTDSTAITVTNSKATVELTASGDVTLKGANVTIKAEQNITLEANSGVTVKSSAGNVAVEGVNTTVKGQAKAELTASGQVAVKGGMVMIN